MSAITINTQTGIAVAEGTFSTFGVFGDTVATVNHKTGVRRDFTKSEIISLVNRAEAVIVPVCEFCGSEDVKAFPLGGDNGVLCQCETCVGIWSEEIAPVSEGIARVMVRTSGAKTSDTVQSFRLMVREASGNIARWRGLMVGGVVTQWG